VNIAVRLLSTSKSGGADVPFMRRHANWGSNAVVGALSRVARGQGETRSSIRPLSPTRRARHQPAPLAYLLDRIAAADTVRTVVVRIEGIGDTPGCWAGPPPPRGLRCRVRRGRLRSLRAGCRLDLDRSGLPGGHDVDHRLGQRGRCWQRRGGGQGRWRAFRGDLLAPCRRADVGGMSGRDRFR
jgi:hypothetical protein